MSSEPAESSKLPWLVAGAAGCLALLGFGTAAVLAIVLLTRSDTPGAPRTTTTGDDKPDAKPEAPETKKDPQKPLELPKLSSYGLAEFCDIANAPDGTLHAIYTDSPDYGKPTYVYHRASSDHGTTWSEAKNLSDDESRRWASFCRVVIDGKGRVYAIWKYDVGSTMIDGPGGNQPGTFAYRCLDHGAWSATAALNEKPAWGFSFFASVSPSGAATVVWSQVSPDAAKANAGLGAASYANLIQQTTLDGASHGTPRALIVPPPLLTEAEWKAKGVTPTYEQLSVPALGIINLRGFISGNGVAHFLGERQKPRSLVYFDGAALATVHNYVGEPGNTFNDPASLVVDSAGQEHVIRFPEAAELPCIRDYPIVGGKLGEPVTVMALKDPVKGALFHWQVAQGPRGRMAVLCGISEKWKISPDDEELYVSFSEGKGRWSERQAVTNDAAAESFHSNQAAAVSTTYMPQFSSLTYDAQERPCILMVSVAHTVAGVSTLRAGDHGAERGLATFSTNKQHVYFRRM